MKEKSGISDGKLHLSQGITRKLATGTSGQFTEIPVIDLSALHSPSATEKDMEHLVQELRSACTNVGFFVAKNHGMDWKIVERAFSALEQFFGLPEETKMKVHQSKSKFYQGYEQAYYTNMNGLKKGGMFILMEFELFAIARLMSLCRSQRGFRKQLRSKHGSKRSRRCYACTFKERKQLAKC